MSLPVALHEAITQQNSATAHAIAHREALEQRDAAILRANEAGATYPEIGHALGLHESRVKQILSAQRAASVTPIRGGGAR